MANMHFQDKAVFKKITWAEYCAYLRQHDHFLEQKSYDKPYTNYLSVYESTITHPSYNFYGIVIDNVVKGVTGIQEFEHQLIPDNSIRYRVLRIDRDQQGKNFGKQLLDFAVSHWPDKQYLFGYIRLSHVGWATHQGFQKIENLTADNNHCFMGKYI